MPGAHLVVNHVHHTYQGVNQRVTALQDISFSLQPGQSLAVVGPSGSGKSTLLLLLAGLFNPTHGEVYINGALLAHQRNETALILQDFGLMPWKAVIDNVALGLLIRKMSKRDAYRAAQQALDAVNLSEYARTYPAELSGGMKQRVALARALTLSADLLLLDEPFSALDALLREELQDLLINLQREHGYTQVIVTHSIEEAVYMGDAIMVLSARPGQVIDVLEGLDPEQRRGREGDEVTHLVRDVRRLLLSQPDGGSASLSQHCFDVSSMHSCAQVNESSRCGCSYEGEDTCASL